MFSIKIKETERGLLFKNGKFVKIMSPGVNYFIGKWRYTWSIFNISSPIMESSWTDILISNYPKTVEEYFQVVNTSDSQVAVIYLDNKLHKVISPGIKKLVWKILADVRVEYIDISQHFEIPTEKVQLFASRLLDNSQIKTFTVAQGYEGLMYVNGKLIKNLPADTYAFFKGQNNVEMPMIDMRKNGMEVQGQEILTNDRVSIRLNFEAVYRVTDSIKAVTKVKDYIDFIYKQIQLALRKAVSSKTLDEILASKESLSNDIRDLVATTIEEIGVTLDSAGVKDIILPGDMRAILNKVVLAQKEAQANNIKRREEVAATRSLLNTAKMLEDNPVLMKLKEFEVLEKVSENVEKLNVFGGLNEIIKQLTPK